MEHASSYRKGFDTLLCMEAPSVSGAQNYQQLCITTHNEEHCLTKQSNISDTPPGTLCQTQCVTSPSPETFICN